MTSLSVNQSATIIEFLQRLDQAHIPNLVLRGGDSLPEQIDGKDIDIFVPEQLLHDAENLLIKAASDRNLALAHRHRRSYFSAFWFTSACSTRSLHIDLYPGAFTWKGLRYVTDYRVLSECRYRNGIRYPAPEIKALNLLLTSLLWGGFVKEKYRGGIASLLSDEVVRQRALSIVENSFGQKSDFLQLLSRPPKCASDVQAWARRLRVGLMIKAFGTRPRQSTMGLLKYFAGEFMAWRKPPGICISILGPDGAGKSLLIRNLETEISPLFGSVQYFHWRPGVLPDIGVALGRRKSVKDTIVADPHSKAPHGTIVSLLRVCYYLADYFVGWLLRVWPGKARNHLIVFDRYAEDMAIDPRRYRLGLPLWLLNRLTQLCPKPDLQIILTAPPDVLLSRKQEVSKRSLEETLARQKKLASETAGYLEVDCSQPPESVCADVSAAIRNILLKRGRKKWRN